MKATFFRGAAQVAGAMFLCAHLTVAHADEATLSRARDAIAQARYADAVDLLLPLEGQLAGDPAFDALIGTAYLEAGEPALAALALERAVTVDPGLLGARLDLAVAYYRAGDLVVAERELLALLDQNPPAPARRRINEYLVLIRSSSGSLKLTREFSVGLVAGFDGNANGATDAKTFLGFDLDDRARETSSPFTELRAGVRLAKPISKGLVLDTRLNLSHRANPEASFIDSTGLNGGIALRAIRERHSASIGLDGYRLETDGMLNSDGVGLSGQWDFNVRRTLRLGVLGRVAQARFGPGLEVKDVDQYLIGGAALWGFGAQRRGTLGGTLIFGRDDAVQSSSRYSRDLYGLRVNGGWAFNPYVKATIGGSVVRSSYDEVFFESEFDAPREDTLYQARAGLDWKMNPKWLFSHILSYSENSTDVDIFAYDRLEARVSFQRLWR